MSGLPTAPDEAEFWWRCRCHDVALSDCPNRELIRSALGAAAGTDRPAPDLAAALRAILGEAEEVTLYQHGNPISALDAIVRRARRALDRPEPVAGAGE